MMKEGGKTSRPFPVSRESAMFIWQKRPKVRNRKKAARRKAALKAKRRNRKVRVSK
jgi:hypothetical protein